MIKFIEQARRRGLVAEIIHTLFNIALAVAVVVLATVFNTPLPAIALVILSKWRVIAVRPRYWWANFLSSLPDLVLGIGAAIIAWQCRQLGDAFAISGITLAVPVVTLEVLIAVLYALWLVIIKPKHTDGAVMFQAAVSQFVGLMAVFTTSQQLPLIAVVLLSFVIAFASARQMLGLYEEKNQGMLASVWGLLVAELALVSWHWSVFYPITPLIRIPQIAIIVTVIAFVATRVYRAWQGDRKVVWSELGAPALLAVAVTAVVLFGFSGLF